MANPDFTTLNQKARKFHEGWMYHQPTNGKVWSRYWMVLRGNMLFIHTNERTGKENMKGTLTLGPDTETKNLPPETKKKGFKFELTTTSSNQERKVNRFKFDKENDRDLWKSFIIGIAVGIVPSDVHLLPGQLKDVHEAIGDMRNKPPPLRPRPEGPNTSTLIPRPTLTDNTIQRPMVRSQSSDMLLETTGNGYRPSGYDSRYNGGDNGSDDSGSFTSHVTHKTKRSESVPNAAEPMGGIRNLREQLKGRQTEITIRQLGMLDQQGAPTYPATTPNYTPPPPLNTGPTVFDAKHSNSGNFFFGGGGSPTSVPQAEVSSTRFNPLWEKDSELNTSGGSSQLSDHGMQNFNNNKTHMFHLDVEKNVVPPSWFFELTDSSREVAEQILTTGRRYGNVLMRTSTSFGASGKYVISMRREVAGGTKLDHYEVVKGLGGFKINVDNKHSPMRCLMDVMDFFISVAGPGTVCMKTNDLDKVFNRIPDSSVPQAALRHTFLELVDADSDYQTPAAILPTSAILVSSSSSSSLSSFDSPPWVTASDGVRASNGGPLGDNWILAHGSREAPPLSPATPGWPSQTLPSATSPRPAAIPQSSPSWATTARGNQHDRVSMTSSIPTTPAPPPPIAEPAVDYGSDAQRYMNITDVPVPAQHFPSETVQRNRDMGHNRDNMGHITNGMDATTLPYNTYGHQPPPAPPVPPPLPVGGFGGPPVAPPAPPPGVPPPAPPLPPPGPPPAPDLNSFQGFNTTRPAQVASPNQNSNFNTTPANAGRSAGIHALQNELLSKLVKRKEVVYGTAEILKNY